MAPVWELVLSLSAAVLGWIFMRQVRRIDVIEQTRAEYAKRDEMAKEIDDLREHLRDWQRTLHNDLTGGIQELKDGQERIHARIDKTHERIDEWIKFRIGSIGHAGG